MVPTYPSTDEGFGIPILLLPSKKVSNNELGVFSHATIPENGSLQACMLHHEKPRDDMPASNKNIFASTLWLTALNADICAEIYSEIRFS